MGLKNINITIQIHCSMNIGISIQIYIATRSQGLQRIDTKHIGLDVCCQCEQWIDRDITIDFDGFFQVFGENMRGVYVTTYISEDNPSDENITRTAKDFSTKEPP